MKFEMLKILKLPSNIVIGGEIAIKPNLPKFGFIEQKNFENVLIARHVDQNSYNYALLRLNGLGYRNWQLRNAKQLVMELGYSHYICINLGPFVKTLKIITRKDRLFIYAQDKSILKNFVHFVYNLKKVNPYTLKGIRFAKKIYTKKLRKKDRMR
jgi:ribosomal protein L6P/L9E